MSNETTLREALFRREISQAELQRRTGASRSTIQRALRDIPSSMEIQTLERLANAIPGLKLKVTFVETNCKLLE